MLRVAEEILLLIMDAESGDIQHSLPTHQRDVVIAGAVLLDLALENRIDMDPERLFVTDSNPVGDELLDPALAEIAGEAETHDTVYWITRIARQGSELRKRARAQLAAHGILEADVNGLAFLTRAVARTNRYPQTGGPTREDVRSRVMRTLFSEEIPEPQDIIIIGLASACGVFESILTHDELAEVRERIDALSRLDMMARTIGDCIRTIEPPEPPAKPVRSHKEIPEAPGFPVVGNALQMAGDVRAFLARNYHELGPIFRVRALGYRFIAFVGPEANTFLGKISGTHLRSHEQYQTFGSAGGAHRVMLSMDGKEHLRMRKLQVKGYSPKTFESNLDVVHQATRDIIDAWPHEQPIGVQRAMQTIIAEQIGLCCTRVSPSEYIDDLLHFLETIVSVHITKRYPPQMEKLPKFRRAKRRLRELHERIMEAHSPEADDGGRRDFVDDIIEANRSDPQFLPETDMFMNIMAPYLVGIDTSATVCAFMLYALLKHPELLERVQKEVDEMFDGGPATAEGLGKLDVTHRVALETLRMYPVVPAITRTASNSFEFGGYRVPAGAELMLGTTVSHHLPECFPDPDRFDIERYTKENRQHRQPGAFAPFGLGRHRCIGSGFSEVQIALTLATVVREAELVLHQPDRPLKIKVTPAPHPDESLQVRLVRRRHPQRAAA